MPTMRRMRFQQAIIDLVFGRQRTGSLLCTSCGVLVGVNDATCYNCGRRNPACGASGRSAMLGRDLGFVPFVIGACIILYGLMLLFSRGMIGMGGRCRSWPRPHRRCSCSAPAEPLPVFGLGRWWTVLSAGWLHGSLLHILFNMMWVRQLAPATAECTARGGW